MAKKNRIIKVNALAFHRAIEVLKKNENKANVMSLHDQPLSTFLENASDYSTALSSIPVEVKVAILMQSGHPAPNPPQLDDDKDMADFGFDDINYLALTKKFNKIAISHNAQADNISVAAVKKCDVVKDCIGLVTNAAAQLINS